MNPRVRSTFAMLALAAGSCLLFGCPKEVRDTDIKVVSVGQVKALWDRQQRGDQTAVYIIDPRPAKTFNAEHIPGARNITLPKIDPKADRDPVIQRFENIVVYGDDPGSATARGMVKRLLAVEYKHIRFFAGGLKDWKSRGYPTDVAPAETKPAEAAPAETKPADSAPAKDAPK